MAGGMIDLVLSLVILAAIALSVGAIFVYRRGQAKQAGLMSLLAVVMLVNAAIWLAPTDSGESLADAAEGGD